MASPFRVARAACSVKNIPICVFINSQFASLRDFASTPRSRGCFLLGVQNVGCLRGEVMLRTVPHAIRKLDYDTEGLSPIYQSHSCTLTPLATLYAATYDGFYRLSRLP